MVDTASADSVPNPLKVQVLVLVSSDSTVVEALIIFLSKDFGGYWAYNLNVFVSLFAAINASGVTTTPTITGPDTFS